MPSQTREVMQRSKSEGKEQRKPVRRDPEKRRQQNVQAQKKYREKLRERLDHLEELAASAAPSRTIENAPTASMGLCKAVTTHGSSGIATHGIAQSLSSYDALGGSVSISPSSSPGECQDLVLQSDDIPSPQNIWDSPTHVDPHLLLSSNHNDGLDPYWTTTIGCGCSSPHVQIQTQGPDPFSYRGVKILSLGPSVTAADPYINNLRIESVCIAAALYNLGLYVGVSEEMICADQSLSPFFQSSADSADDMIKANIVYTAQQIFKTLKPDLRPRSEQITIQHHPYIDILPFPTLRKNLITHQEEVDEDEFFHDILTGLVCWGGAGIGRRDRDDSTGYASTGTPWDVRSWEAKVWFEKKYWALLGGEDGELVRQSEWWRSIRGEDTVDKEVYS